MNPTPSRPPEDKRPAAPEDSSPPGDYRQGKAHVSRPEEVERRAAEAARQDTRGGKPADEGGTPGGVSS